MDNDTTLTSTAFLPPVAWYLAALSGRAWYWEAHENYQKGGYRNRCRIATANGPQWLSLPLEKGKHQATPIQAVRLSYSTDWVRQQRLTIQSAYGRAPFFFYYSEPLFALLGTPSIHLREHNEKVFALLQQWLALPFGWLPTTHYEPQPAVRFDLRYDRQAQHGPALAYPQLFADRYGFDGNLSILDLLFCLGPEAGTYLRRNALKFAL